MLRAFGERAARNAPIQGTAADIIKLAMIRVFDSLQKEVPSAKLILQVHDELMIECKKEEAEDVAKMLTECMESAIKMSIPLKVEAEIADNWYDVK
jgi:DNA polymerase-1